MHLIKQRRTLVELDQKIHITVGRFLPACTRTEHIDLPDLVLPCNSVNVITLRPNCIKHAHRRILSAWVTRSLSRLELVRGPSASPRHSQDTGIITGHRYYSKKLTRSIGYLAPTFYGYWPLALLDDADADDRRRRLERLDDVRRDRRVGVDQRVGDVAAALVGDRVDVDLGVAED